MESLKVYLVQRAKYAHPHEGSAFLKKLDLDYMGSAEFEFGSIPLALMSLLNTSDQRTLTHFSHEGVGYTVYIRNKHVEGFLAYMAESNKIRHKENPRYDDKRYDTWIGIDQGCEFILTRSKALLKVLPFLLQKSGEILLNNPGLVQMYISRYHDKLDTSKPYTMADLGLGFDEKDEAIMSSILGTDFKF